MFAFTFTALAALAVAPLAQAVPLSLNPFSGPKPSSACSLDAAKLSVVGSTLPAASGAPIAVTLGVGVQNYTCDATNKGFVAAGALAELFDVSCFQGTPMFASLSDMAFGAWNATPAAMDTAAMIKAFTALPKGIQMPPVLGQHYFVNPTTPKWDFTSSGSTKGSSKAFLIGAKNATSPAPNPKADVPWLQLKSTSGDLATSVYRVATKGGQPPANGTCTAPVSVKYVAAYYFYKGSK